MKDDLAEKAQENLNAVWNQRDSVFRLTAIQNLYHPDATLNHVGGYAQGHAAINRAVGEVLKSLPQDFVFFLLKPVVVNNDITRTH